MKRTLALTVLFIILVAHLNAQSSFNNKISGNYPVFRGKDNKIELGTLLFLSQQRWIKQNITCEESVFYANISSSPTKSRMMPSVPDNKCLINTGTIQKPPLSFLRITTEIATGGLLGYGIVKLGLDNLEGDIGMGYVILVGGYIVGNTLGVYIIGNIGDETGSFLATLVGSLSGMLLGFVGSSITNDSSVSSIFFLACPALGATYMFNNSRRYKLSHNSSALINFKKDGARFAFPIIYCSLHFFYSMDIITLKF